MSEPERRERRSKGCGFGCLIILVIGLGVFAALSALIWYCMYNGDFEGTELGNAVMHSSDGHGEDEFPKMIEKWSSGSGTTKVIRVPVTGMIMLNQSGWGDRSAVTALRSIRRATHDPSVKAIILEVNSGGGGITASDIIYKALKDFKESQKGRKVVTIMGDIAASGAYYISLPSDHIMAHPTTVTGSIGVIMQAYNFKKLAAKIGITDVTVKSGANKDFFNPLHDIKPEQMAIMQRVISRMYDRFISLVAENRELKKDVVAQLADGRIYLADEAVQNGLIDSIGYYEDAEAKTAELLGTEDIKVFRYVEQMSLSDIFGVGLGAGVNFRKLIRGEHSDSGLMYLWQPASIAE